jgi:hypothetical protein
VAAAAPVVAGFGAIAGLLVVVAGWVEVCAAAGAASNSDASKAIETRCFIMWFSVGENPRP